MSIHLPQRWLGFFSLFWPGLLLGQATLQIDLRHNPTESSYSRFQGALGNGRFGVPVCGGHDCDGDGHPDVVLATPVGSRLGRTGAGNVTIVWGGGVSLGETIDTGGVGDRLLHIAGAQPIEACGSEVWMDDVDGDGLGDLLIGRQNFTPAALRRGAGALTIIFGGGDLRRLSRQNAVLDLSSPPGGVQMLHLYGARAYDRLGIWMRTGDLDGDGIADLAVGADEADGPDERNRGEVFVVRGGEHLRDAGVVDLLEYPPAALAEHVMRVLPPPLSEDGHFGATVHLGDLDGNGRAELVVSATLDRSGAGLRLANAPAGTGARTGGLERGSVFILWDNWFTAERWRSGAEIRISGVESAVSLLKGGRRNLRFGEEVVAGGDYDGDGRPDLFIGDQKATSKNGAEAGLGYVFFDAAGLRGRGLSMDLLPGEVRHSVIEGASAGSLSADAAGFGDLDEDGSDELIICSPHERPLGRINAGSLHVLYGQRNGWPQEIDLAADQLPQNMRTVHVIGGRGNTRTDLGDTLGYSLAIADANGDGTPDIITNEMQGNGSRKVDVGNLVLYSGRALLPPPNEVAIGTMETTLTGEGGAILRWRSRWRLRYHVERSHDLMMWERLGHSIEGTGALLEYHDEATRGAKRAFYRLASETAG